MFSPKDVRVLRIVKLLEDPYLFQYIEKFFQDRIAYEEAKITQLTSSLISTDNQRDSLNRHIVRKQILGEIGGGLRESLIEYMQSDDSDFTEPGGAEYQKVNGDL